MRTPRTRRDVLRATGVGLAGTTAFAGCLGQGATDGGGQPDDDPADTAMDGDGSTDTAMDDGGNGPSNGLDGHPAARKIDSQPFQGPPPGEAMGTIVAFEDPSCTRCRAFEQGTVPKIHADLTETGKATFVFRGYPIVYPWGNPACHALEATFTRDPDAHFALKDHYYANQSAFDGDNVLAKTESFLTEHTDVDGSAVVAAVEAGETKPAVQTDLDAGKAANATITPTIFLFRDGKFQTKAQGSVSFATIAAALGL